MQMECLYDSVTTLTSAINVEESTITATHAVTAQGADLITSQLGTEFKNTIVFHSYFFEKSENFLYFTNIF